MSAARRICLVSNSAGLDQCQSRCSAGRRASAGAHKKLTVIGLIGTRYVTGERGTVLTPTLIDTENHPFGTSWTLCPDRTMMCCNPELGAPNGRRGLAAEPGPREIRGGIPRE